ncbi:translation initiation factor eIF3 subunit g [Coemansia sp. RSA 1813]|nr:translation initiation factor eIF3 subunit g [Coemansia sp. RSA 1646]KAJ1768635.1 translation initiation factor eIF3 subunit g [Coemansia sp. RSA 1843]KAJ2086571.1 translation initiation factor eIF3 subunit g [Coemansia sp. RSA 986]KAJ2211205.1 translation initiation factor eIF3 subunit g [Coemansia sp. RSA 487]KAJ2565062.1 translation initiation factor eIF3 subunit g [Coemansia sp. RSA 1813]
MVNTSWADDVDEPQQQVSLEPQVINNEDGTKTVIEYRTNGDGKKVRLTRRIREKVVQEHVNRAVAERKKWVKFGAEEKSPPGPNISSTTLAEQVMLKLSQYAAQQKQSEMEEEEQQQKQQALNKPTRILCRVCRGDHFTAKCPYKGTLVSVEGIIEGAGGGDADGSGAGATAAAAGAEKAGGESGASSYVPPHMRAGASKGPGIDFRERRDDRPTIRITNLSEDVREADVKELCMPFGQTTHTFVPLHRDTGKCKGYAFVSFYEHSSAERAIAKLSGFGYDNLILKAEWANSSNK